jgi:TolB-like protein
MTRAVAGALLLALMVLIGCAKPPQSFIHSRYDFSRVKKVAVLPLENLTADQQAGERVRRVVLAEILAARVVDAVELGQVNLSLNQLNIQSITALSADTLKTLGTRLGVQLLIVGSVDFYDRVNVGGATFPEVTVSLRAVDAETGTIVWSSIATGGGAGVAGRLFGFGGDSMSEATQKVIRSEFATLFK